MLAHKYVPSKTTVGGYYISEKLDGTRVFWDGGLSRGCPTKEVPYANITNPKTGQLKDKIRLQATGLWSRYGNPIAAPDWFLNQLPCCPLDGELWAGRGGFQLCRSICSRDEPGEDWDKIKFAVFGSPSFDAVFSDGRFNNPNMTYDLLRINVDIWLRRTRPAVLGDFQALEGPKMTFDTELAFLRDALPCDDDSCVYLLRQKKLPIGVSKAAKVVEEELNRIIDAGGEGVVMRAPASVWVPKRTRTLLKYKPMQDADGIVVGFTSGRATEKGSKLLGRIGALILNYGGKRLELSGLTDEERLFKTSSMTHYATTHPGLDMPDDFAGKYFNVGDSVTFKYRELSVDYIPKEARYHRVRDEE